MNLSFWQQCLVLASISCAGAAFIVANAMVARGEARWPLALACAVGWCVTILLVGTVFVMGLRCMAHAVIP